MSALPHLLRLRDALGEAVQAANSAAPHLPKPARRLMTHLADELALHQAAMGGLGDEDAPPPGSYIHQGAWVLPGSAEWTHAEARRHGVDQWLAPDAGVAEAPPPAEPAELEVDAAPEAEAVVPGIDPVAEHPDD